MSSCKVDRSFSMGSDHSPDLQGIVYKVFATSCYHLTSTPCTQLASLSPLKEMSLTLDFSFYDWYMLKQDALASNEHCKGLV